MKYIYALLLTAGLTGCAVAPYEQLNLDTPTNFRKPEAGKAGIYVYQWKTGVLGAGLDVDFEIKGAKEISLNTGEYGYFELSPGKYEYKLTGGIFKQYIPITLEANKNYFFRAALLNASDTAFLVRDQNEINETKKNILTQKYEMHDVD